MKSKKIALFAGILLTLFAVLGPAIASAMATTDTGPDVACTP